MSCRRVVSKPSRSSRPARKRVDQILPGGRGPRMASHLGPSSRDPRKVRRHARRPVSGARRGAPGRRSVDEAALIMRPTRRTGSPWQTDHAAFRRPGAPTKCPGGTSSVTPPGRHSRISTVGRPRLMPTWCAALRSTPSDHVFPSRAISTKDCNIRALIRIDAISSSRYFINDRGHGQRSGKTKLNWGRHCIASSTKRLAQCSAPTTVIGEVTMRLCVAMSKCSYTLQQV
jgi:hypothetical protein